MALPELSRTVSAAHPSGRNLYAPSDAQNRRRAGVYWADSCRFAALRASEGRELGI